MFFPGGKELDPEQIRNMSVSGISEEIREAIGDSKFLEMTQELYEIGLDEKQYKKVMSDIETYIRSSRYSDKTGFDINSLIGFYNGIFYGMALATKINVILDKKEPAKAERAIKMIAILFHSIETGVKNIKDDKWFENLMKNVKVVPPEKPKKLPKDKKSKK